MVWISQWLDLLNLTDLINSPTTAWAVNNLILPVIIGVIVILIGWILLDRKREARQIKREEEIKQKEKLEQIRNKEVERENEKKSISTHLLSEIESNQTQLKPLVDCATNQLDYDEEKAETLFPKELNFYSLIYSNLSDKLRLLDDTNINKSKIYHSKLKQIEEEYKKFKNIYGYPSKIHAYVELSRITNRPWDEIQDFLENTIKAYDLGEELIKDLKE